ncbi:MAG: hypothetical protein SGILL_000656 [Bacillariaceae sp.]
MKSLTGILLVLILPISQALSTVIYSVQATEKRDLALKAHPSSNRKKSKAKNMPNIFNDKKNVDIDDLLSGMGLETVPSQKKNASIGNTQQHIKRSSTIPIDSIDLATQLNYARNGHAVLRNLIPLEAANLVDIRKEILSLAKDQEVLAWKQKVLVASDNANLADACKTITDCQEALDKLLGSTDNNGDNDTVDLPFLQYFNTWRNIPLVKDLAFALGHAASILMDVPTVRLYQDAVFWKRRDDGPTPWHVDARMAPFDTTHMITFWIPLHDVGGSSAENGEEAAGGTGLIFCSKSHSDFALPYWNPVPSDDDDSKTGEWDRLQDRYPKRLVNYMPMKMGDVTVHSGWTLHCSSGNSNNPFSEDRVALAISFVDSKADIRPDWESTGDNEDAWSYQEWCKDVTPRTEFSHELVPIVWPQQATT